jgi:hypothetical protein
MNLLQRLGLLILPWGLTAAVHGAPASKAELKTEAEKSQWKKTGRFAEVEKFCEILPKNFPDQVVCETFGVTPEGRPLLAFIAGEKAYLKPEKNRHRPVVLFQGAIHAGEIDGKDAGLVFLREVLQGKRLPNILQKTTLVFVPVFNVDGHERFGKNNRPNQVGPEEMGWRTTAQNYNLNRDYLKADAPEMRAMLELLNTWDPLVYVDLHVTDGAQFQHDIAVMVEPSLAGPLALKNAGTQLSNSIMRDLKVAGNKPLWFYPSFAVDDDPASGIFVRPQSARFSNGYWAQRNRLGVLVETHSWRDYAHRVQSTIASLDSIVKEAAENGSAWRIAANEADQQSSRLAGKTVTLSYKNSEKVETIDFLGYEYTRRPSAISGQLMTVYNPKKNALWAMPLRKEVLPDLQREAPPAGYVIPAAYREIFEPRLKAHRIQFSVLKQSQEALAQVYRMSEVKLSAASYEKHQRAEYKGLWQEGIEAMGPGALWIPIAQPAAVLIMQLLEPESADSLLAWGYMNEIFERKEYMEAYVAEEVAIDMLKDPAVRQEFDKKLAEDPAFAKSAQQRLDFFARRHASFDKNMNRYPILRLPKVPQKLSTT